MANFSIISDSVIYFLNCQDCGCDTDGGEAFCDNCKQDRIRQYMPALEPENEDAVPGEAPAVHLPWDEWIYSESEDSDELEEEGEPNHCDNCQLVCDYFLCDDCTYGIMVHGDDDVVGYFGQRLERVRRFIRGY